MKNIQKGNYIVIGGKYNDVVKWAEQSYIGLLSCWEVIEVKNETIKIKGYPNGIEYGNVYKVFNNKEDWEKWLQV